MLRQRKVSPRFRATAPSFGRWNFAHENATDDDDQLDPDSAQPSRAAVEEWPRMPPAPEQPPRFLTSTPCSTSSSSDYYHDALESLVLFDCCALSLVFWFATLDQLPSFELDVLLVDLALDPPAASLTDDAADEAEVDQDLAGTCFDPSGEYIYVGAVGGIAEWKVRGAEQRWWSEATFA